MKNYFLYPANEAALSHGFELSVFRTKNIPSVLFHSHDFYELYVLFEGDVSYHVNHETYRLERNSAIIVPPNTPHRAELFIPNDVYDRTVLWISKSVYYNVSPSGNALPALSPIKLTDSGVSELVSLFALLRDTQNRLDGLISPQNIENEYAKSLISACLAFVARETIAKSYSKIVTRAVNYIQTNLDKPLSLEEVSDNLFVSKYYLSHRFKLETGATVFDFITSKKIAYAKRLLLQQLSAKEVADMCGYPDYSNFYKTFKARTNLSPKDFSRSDNKD